MSWWGKVIGGAFGFMLGGPLGAALGAAFGHNFDEAAVAARSGNQRRGSGWSQAYSAQEQIEQTQTAFFTATFTMMGHLAKADGTVSQQEIAVAEAVMQQMRLAAPQRKVAMALFAEGKKAGFDMQAALQQFRLEAHRSSHLLQMFMEIQIAVALSDGNLHSSEKRMLEQCANTLGFSAQEYQFILRRLQASQHHQQGARTQSTASKLSDAYKVLGLTKEASDDEVKKTYRRLMNQHHPDKLVAKGLPQEMMDLAAKKTMEIKEAYELIKQSRE